MKTLSKYRLARSVAILAFASLLASCGSNPPGSNSPNNSNNSSNGSNGSNGGTTTTSCDRGVLSNGSCTNKSSCTALKDCLDGFTCDSGSKSCKPVSECTGANDDKCGAGSCQQVAGSWVCVNPVKCDPLATTLSWQCAPGFYCTSAGDCVPTPKRDTCGDNGCDHGVCTMTGCASADFCTSDRDCLADELCSFSGHCVGRYGDDACGNKCNDISGKSLGTSGKPGAASEGGVCDRYFEKCVNISDPSCSDLERCQCGDNQLGKSEGKCGIPVVNPDGTCLKGYQWSSTESKCIQNPCSTNQDCLRDFGGGVCDQTSHTCVEPTVCASTDECSAKIADPTALPVSGSAHRRVCARLPEQVDAKCIWLDDEGKKQCEDNGYEYKYNEGQLKLSCVDKDGCHDSVTCDPGFACNIKEKKCLPTSSFKKCTSEGVSDASATPETLTLKQRHEANVCKAKTYYFKFASAGTADKTIKITLALTDKSQVGNAKPKPPTLTNDGSSFAPTVDNAGENSGIWSYTYQAPNSLTGDWTFPLEFTSKSIAAGFNFTIKVDTLDADLTNTCGNATSITPDSNGTWSEVGKLEAGSGTPKYNIDLACGSTYSTATKDTEPNLYSFTLTKQKFVTVGLGPVGTTKLQPRLIIRRDCAEEDTLNSTCMDKGAAESLQFSGLLDSGRYTVIVDSGNATADLPLSYDLRYSEVDPVCTTGDDQCLPGGSLEYCNTSVNKLETKPCADGCDVNKRACREDFGKTCESAREIDFSNVSGKVEEVLNMGNFRDPQQTANPSENYKPNVAGGDCRASANDNSKVQGYNAFYSVKVAPKSWLQVSVGPDPKANANFLTYSAYLLKDCTLASCQKYSEGAGRAEPTGFVYHNNTNDVETYTVVIDGTLLSDNNYYDNKWGNALVTFSSTQEDLCDMPSEKKCFNNREVRICGSDGYWRTSQFCSPAVGCNTSSKACNEQKNETCGGATTITSTPIHDDFIYSTSGDVTVTSPCGNLTSSDRGQVLYYKVTTTKDDQNVRVVVTPDANTAYLKLYRIDSCASNKCQDPDGTSRVTEATSSEKESLVLEFNAKTKGDYVVAVQNKDRKAKIEGNISMGFTIEANVSDPCDPYGYTPTCSGTGDTGKFKYCTDFGVEVEVTCNCKEGGDKFCYNYTSKKKDIEYPTSCLSPRILDTTDPAVGQRGVISQSKKETKAYSGTNDGNPTAYTNRFNALKGKHGQCFFDKDTVGYDSVYAIKLNANDALTVHAEHTSSSGPSVDKDLRVFLLKECQNIDTCYGLDGVSSNQGFTYRAEADGYVFVVVDSVSEQGEFKLTWEVKTGATTCAPDQAYCDATTTTQINTCNSDGTGNASTETCVSGTSCLTVPAMCGVSGGTDAACSTGLVDLTTVTFPQKLYFEPQAADAPLTSPTCFEGGTSSKGKSMVVKIHADVDDILRVKGYASSDTVHAGMWLAPDTSACDTIKSCEAFSHEPKVVGSSTTPISATLSHKFITPGDHKLILTSLEENSDNIPLFYNIDLYSASTKPQDACDPTTDTFKCADDNGEGAIYECIDYTWEKIRSCTTGTTKVLCDSTAGKTACEGDRDGEYLYNPIIVTSGATYNGSSTGAKKTISFDSSSNPVRQSCVWDISSFSGGDDFYKINLQKDESVKVSLKYKTGSGEVVAIYSLDANKQLVCLANDPIASRYHPDKSFEFVAPSTGDYYVVVMYESSGASSYDLTAEITSAASSCEPYTSACLDNVTLQVCGSDQQLSMTTCPYGCYAANCIQEDTSPIATVCDSTTPSLTTSFVATNGVGSTLPDGKTTTAFPSQLLTRNLTDASCAGLGSGDEVYTNDRGYKVSLQGGQTVTVYAKYSYRYREPAAFVLDCAEAVKTSYAPSTSNCYAGIGQQKSTQYKKVLEFTAKTTGDYYLGFGQPDNTSSYQSDGTLYFVDISTSCDPSLYTTTCSNFNGELLYCNASGFVSTYQCTDSGTPEKCDVTQNACPHPTGTSKVDAIPVVPTAGPNGTQKNVTMPASGDSYDVGGATCGTSTGTAMSGSELLYKVVVPVNKELTVKAKETAGNKGVGLYIVTDPDKISTTCKAFYDNSALASSWSQVAYQNSGTSPETVYVIVDSPSGGLNGESVDLKFIEK